MPLRSRNAVLVYKQQTDDSTAASPVAANDAILVGNPTFTPSNEKEQLNMVSGSLDAGASIPGGTKGQIGFNVHLKGSGVGGTAPEYGDMLKACGLSESIVAAVAAEVLAAGGSTTVAELGVSASSSDGAYVGSIIKFTAGTVVGESTITAYDGGTKMATLADTMSAALDAGTTYEIEAQVVYGKASNNIPSGTFKLFMDGLRFDVEGARGDFEISATPSKTGGIQFTFDGMFAGTADEAVPTPAYDATDPVQFMDGAGTIDRLPTAFNRLSVKANNQMVQPLDGNQAKGFGAAIISGRGFTGSIDPLMALKATRDSITAMENSTDSIICARWGDLAGNKVSMLLTGVKTEGVSPSDDGGLMRETLEISIPDADAGFYLSL